jgi:hypothetical protein
MRSCSDFEKLSRTANRRISRLHSAVSQLAGQNADWQQLDRHVGRAIIEAHNTWNNFARSYLMSYLVNPRRTRGDRVSFNNLSATSPGNLLHIAAKACKGPAAAAPSDRRDEPKWYDTGSFLKACNALAPTNLADIQSALSMQTRVFSDMPAFRNFYAHRNEETAERAIGLAKRHYLIAGVRHPTEALMRPATKRTQPLLYDWLDEMRIVMDFMCG